MSLSTEIKEAALELGYCKAGVTTAEDFFGFAEELASRGEHYDHWVNSPRSLKAGASPRQLMPEAKSIIVTAYDYMQKDYPQALLPMVARAYLSRSYVPKPEMIHAARAQLFQQYLESRGCTVNANMFLPVRPAAMRAGVINFGRNNFAYVDGIGSFVILYAFVVDTELEYDEPAPQNKCPAGCTACIDACPTGAIYAPFRVDPRKCVGFHNWTRQEGPTSRVDTVIPLEVREQLGVRIHGCDACQEACPRNRPKLAAKLPKDEFLELVAQDFSLDKLLHMQGDFYRSRVYPIMHNYIRDLQYFQRNAAVAIGNTGDERYVPDLIAELEHPQALVRRHVAWALAKIAGSGAKQVLESSLARESDDGVRAEIQTALAGM